MDMEVRKKIASNLFRSSHKACEPWEEFSWHRGADGQIDSHVSHSSQALAIDVFGTIKGSTDRDRALDVLAQHIGLPSGGQWRLTLEWLTPKGVLGEPRPTQVDIHAESPQALMLFECKFTEPGGGFCSQTQQRNGQVQCTGNYEPQTNPLNGIMSRCALTGKGVRYWEVVPQVFHLDAATNHSPCPFAGSAYQWMRNLVLSNELARVHKKRAAFVVVYADGARFPMAQKVKSAEWPLFASMVRSDGALLRTLSYQEILALIRKAPAIDHELWRELNDWVARKIAIAHAHKSKGQQSC